MVRWWIQLILPSMIIKISNYDCVLLLQQGHQFAVLLDYGLEVAHALVGVDAHLHHLRLEFEVAHQLKTLNAFPHPVHPSEYNALLLPGVLLLPHLSAVLALVLEQLDLVDRASGVGQINRRKDDDLPIFVLELRDDDLGELLPSEEEIHPEQAVRVGLVVDLQAVVAYCQHER